MNNFDEVLMDKFEYIYHYNRLIMFGEVPCDYHSDWDREKLIKEFSDNYGEVWQGAQTKGKEVDIPKRAQIVFNYLLSQVNEFDFTRPLDFIVFEALLYNLFTDAYRYQRYSAQSEQLIFMGSAKEILDEKHYQYLSLIYDIVQLQFWWWLNCRALYNGESREGAEKFGVSFKRTKLENVGTEELWSKIYELAASAHALYPIGELANRFMFIADVQLIYGVGKWKDEYNPDNEKLVKYLSVRKDFISNCFDSSLNDNEFEWLNGLPNFEEERNPMEIMRRTLDKDSYYLDIMTQPIRIGYYGDAFPNILTNLLKEISVQQNKQKVTETLNKELKKTIEELERERDAKHSIINKFSHTAKNMMTTSLQEVAKVLLENDDEELKNHGRTLLLEYITKRSMQKVIELLQLEFEDDRDTFIQKIKGSMSTKNKYVTIHHLLSDAFMRCLITMFYDDSQHGEDMFTGFTERANYEKDLVLLNDQFEMAIRSGHGNDIFTWFINNMKDIRTSFSPTWSELKFEELNYASVMITDLLAELTSNVFKYADKSKEIYYLFEETEEQLIVTIKNATSDKTKKAADGGKGLISYNRSFKQLNRAGRIEGEAIKTEFTSDMQFETTVYLSKEIFQAK